MKLAYISSEITPYASTGGLAEVAGSLPRVLRAAGHEVVCFMPCYRRVMEGPHRLESLDIRISVPVGMRSYTADVARIQEGGVTTYFIRRDEFFDRSQLYNLPDRDYEDNFERFVFFQKAVVALLDRLEIEVDIVHCNDWQTGLMPYFLEHGVHGRRRGRREKVVFTLHNIAYQGLFPDSDYALTNLPFSAFSVDTFEYYGKIGCLKAGITGSDAVTTVSPTYAREILTPEGGFGLDGVLLGIQKPLSGILNGIDTDAWNPATDANIAATYDSRNLDGKRLCRERLVARMNLRVNSDTLILAMVSRLIEEKGIGLLAEIMPEVMKRNMAFVLLGSGQKAYESLVLQWVDKWPGRVGVRLEYNAPLAHEIQAGADMMLLPSKTEPCGLTQFCSQRYGTLPVVHAVGGLRDSVLDPSESARPTGIKFAQYTSSAFLAGIDRGAQLLRTKEHRAAIISEMMNLDVSWQKPARQYEQLYGTLLSPS